MQLASRVRVIVAVTVSVLLTCAVAPDLGAARTGRPGTWRRSVASKLRRPRSKPRDSHQTFARAAFRRQAKRVKNRLGRIAQRRGQRIARAGIWVGMGLTWLGATHVEPAHQMKAVIGGIVLAAASAGVAWVGMIRESRRADRAFHDEFQARYDSLFEDFHRANAAGGSGASGAGAGGWQVPRLAPSIPRPPEGQTWPADLVAVLEEMASATSKKDLSRIYRAAAKRYHPDAAGDLEQSKALNGFYTDLQRELPP